MAVRGRHRRYQPNRINRASLTVTAGGAGLALPLVGTGTAHAADAATWDKVAACESTDDWDINTGAEDVGLGEGRPAADHPAVPGGQGQDVHGGHRRHPLRHRRHP